jgi:prepilin-type N-terminal cleavage/methylation domain-containing protein
MLLRKLIKDKMTIKKSTKQLYYNKSRGSESPTANIKSQFSRAEYQVSLPNGFTLVELIVYIAILSSFLVIATYFSWDILFGQVKSETAQEVQQNSRLAIERLTYEIKRAKSINSAGSSLALTMQDDTTTIFDLSNNTLRINENGAGAIALTSSQAKVSSLTFSDRSTGNSSNVKVEMTINHINPENVNEWDRSENFEFAIELRGAYTTDSPTPTPTQGTTCGSYCAGLPSYSSGVCRANAAQCANNGETHEAGGDQYCTGGGGSDTCCCAN